MKKYKEYIHHPSHSSVFTAQQYLEHLYSKSRLRAAAVATCRGSSSLRLRRSRERTAVPSPLLLLADFAVLVALLDGDHELVQRGHRVATLEHPRRAVALRLEVAPQAEHRVALAMDARDVARVLAPTPTDRKTWEHTTHLHCTDTDRQTNMGTHNTLALHLHDRQTDMGAHDTLALDLHGPADRHGGTVHTCIAPTSSDRETWEHRTHLHCTYRQTDMKAQ